MFIRLKCERAYNLFVVLPASSFSVMCHLCGQGLLLGHEMFCAVSSEVVTSDINMAACHIISSVEVHIQQYQKHKNN
jgi:ribosomal protein S27E